MATASGTSESPRLLDPIFMRKLEGLALTVKRSRGGVAKGERRSREKGISTDFADYRDYVQGDDLRHVDWNIFGRLGEVHLKLFEEFQDLTLHVLIDASASMGYGSPTKIDFARKLAAALGYIALSGHERVAVAAFAGDSLRRLLPCRGKGSVPKLFNFIESIELGGGTDIETAARGYLSQTSTRGITVIVSDFFDECGFEPAIRRLVSARSDVYAVHVLAPEEIEPKLTGDLKLVDSETGAMTEISVTRSLLKRYEQNRDAFIDTVRRYCVARGVGYLPVSSDIALERLTLDLMRNAGMVQ